MKESFEHLNGLFEEHVIVKRMNHTLKEGESFTEVIPLRGGVTYAVTTEGWEEMGAVFIELLDENGETVRPEVDSSACALYFAPLRNGPHQLRVSLDTISQGRTSVEVIAIARELSGSSRNECRSDFPR